LSHSWKIQHKLTPKCHNKLVEIPKTATKNSNVIGKEFKETQTKRRKQNMNRKVQSIAFAIVSMAGILTQASHAGIATPSAVFTKQLATGNNFIATPFARSEEGVGTITAQSGSTLTLAPYSGPTSYSSSYAQSSTQVEPYVLEILDGEYIGYSALITANTANTMTLAGSTPTGLVGSKYVIRKDWTIASLFGPAASSNLTLTDLTAGDDVTSADQIRIMNDNGTLGAAYFRAQTTAGIKWVNEAEQVVDNVRLPFGKGIFVKALNPKTVVLSGIVRGTRTRLDIVGGTKINLLANPVPFPIKLADCGLEITGGTSSATADNLRLWSGSGWVNYWRYTDGLWYSGTTASTKVSAGNVEIPAGSAFLIKRNGNRGNLSGASALKFAAAAVAP